MHIVHRRHPKLLVNLLARKTKFLLMANEEKNDNVRDLTKLTQRREPFFTLFVIGNVRFSFCSSAFTHIHGIPSLVVLCVHLTLFRALNCDLSTSRRSLNRHIETERNLFSRTNCYDHQLCLIHM